MKHIDFKHLFHSLLITLVISISMASANPPVIVKAQVDKARATTSDIILFTITLDAHKGIKVELPQFGGEIHGFRITDFETTPPSPEADRMISKRVYKLQADLAGTYILPRITIHYEDANKKKQTVKTSEIFVEIESRLKKDGDGDGKTPADIRDIKGLVTLPYQLGVWEIVTIITLILVLGIIGFLWYRTSRPKPNVKNTLGPPHVQAQRRLKELEQMALAESTWSHPEKGIALEKKFHFTLSEIAREYFEGTFEIPATDMTSEEIKKRVAPFQGLEAQLKKSFMDLLDHTDLVKFADFRLGLPKGLELLEITKIFIAKTSPPESSESSENNENNNNSDENSEDSFV